MSADIRPARMSDIDALLAIEDAVFEGDRLSRRSFLRHMDSKSASLLVAELESQVAGYALLFHRQGSRSARLYSLAVAKPFTSRGIGRRLLEATEARAFTLGRTVLTLEVREDNELADRLYRQAGFREVAKIPDYYEDGATALRLHKALEKER